VCFGSQAIENFLSSNNLSYIIRAHEAHAHGVSLSKGARVFTVFSTSKDHRQVGVICPYVIVIELDKRLLFIYSPIRIDQIWTFYLVYIYADWSFC
jgi:hypothetical protein